MRNLVALATVVLLASSCCSTVVSDGHVKDIGTGDLEGFVLTARYENILGADFLVMYLSRGCTSLFNATAVCKSVDLGQIKPLESAIEAADPQVRVIDDDSLITVFFKGYGFVQVKEDLNGRWVTTKWPGDVTKHFELKNMSFREVYYDYEPSTPLRADMRRVPR